MQSKQVDDVLEHHQQQRRDLNLIQGWGHRKLQAIGKAIEQTRRRTSDHHPEVFAQQQRHQRDSHQKAHRPNTQSPIQTGS